MRLIAVAAAAVLLGTGGATASIPTTLATSGPAWSPDGSTIAFVGGVPGSYRGDVYTIRPDGSGLRNLTGDDTRTNLYDPRLPASHSGPAWSSDGRLSYVTALGAYNARVFEYATMNADGSRKHVVVREPTAQTPSWSPDGTRLTLETYEAIAVANVASGRVRTIVEGAGWSLWSPHGERIAVGALAAENNSEVYTVRADGRQRRRLTHARGYDFPVAWSRDGKRLAFTSERHNLGGERGGPLDGLFVMDASGRHQRRVGTGRQADWSPSGRRLAYSDGRDLYTVGVDGRGRRLTARGAAAPAWSPDGRWIAFDGPSGIELVKPDGSGRHALLPPVPDVGSPER